LIDRFRLINKVTTVLNHKYSWKNTSPISASLDMQQWELICWPHELRSHLPVLLFLSSSAPYVFSSVFISSIFIFLLLK
jgi:hypothetical protein